MPILFLLLIVGTANATDVKFVNRKPVFLKATVDGRKAWNDKEKSDLVNGLTKVETGTITAHTPVVVDVTPKSYEINLTTICSPKSMEQYEFLRTNEGLKACFKDLKAEFDFYDFNGDASGKEEVLQKLRWLKLYYKSLP